MPASKIRGQFVWHELMTNDVRAAADFYRSVVGWNPQVSEQSADYTIFSTADGMMAGLMAIPADAESMGAKPSWITYVGTPDVDATVNQAKTLGASVIKAPDDIPNIGRFSVLKDP